MNSEYETETATPAIKLLCKLYVEKVQREQQELSLAAAQTEPDKIKDGYLLNIEHGIWVREKKSIDVENIKLKKEYINE
jgi:hypothetical protein